MKMDKETVVKHQFWFLLGGYLFFWLLAVLWLKFSAPDTIKVAKDSYEKAKKDVTTAQSSAVNKSKYLPPWEEATAEFAGHKNTIWEKAWIWQANMFTWPKEWLSKYKMLSPQEAISTDDLSNYSRTLYPEQIKSLRADAPHWIAPVELLGGFDAIFKPKTKADWHDTPTREECWLAQEDIWVKRELFYIIWNAVAGQAVMHPMPMEKAAKPDPNIKASYRFANKIWEVTLHIRANDKGALVIGGDSTIKNIHPSGHPLALTSAKGKGVWFNVSQNGVRTLFEVRGEPVNNGETRMFSVDKDGKRADYPPLEGINWSKAKEQPILVSLGFDQTNCPIRRLNAIELGQQDCRSFVWSLQPNHPLAELDASPEDANKAQESAASSASSMGGGGGGMSQEQIKNQQAMMQQKMMGGMGGRGGGGQSAEVGNPTTHNQFERNRYLQASDIDKKANPPSRHLPLAIQFITEQSHMHDVLLALANSRLRFQITQVDFRHEKNYVPQTEEEKKDNNKEKTGTGGPGVFMGPTAMPNMSGGMMGGAGGGNMRARIMEQMQRQRQMQSPMGGGGAPNNMMQQQMRQEMMRRAQQGGSGGGPGATGGPPMMQNPMMMGGAMGPGKGPFLANSPKSRGSNLPQLGTGGPTDPKQNTQNQPDDNLVELTIYGIATLYRAPDPPKAEEQSGQSGTTPPASTPQAQGTTPAANGTTQPAAETNTTANPEKKATTGAGTTPNPPTTPGTAAPPNNGAPKPADAKQAEKPADKQPAAPKTAPPPAGEKR